MKISIMLNNESIREVAKRINITEKRNKNKFVVTKQYKKGGVEHIVKCRKEFKAIVLPYLLNQLQMNKRIDQQMKFKDNDKLKYEYLENELRIDLEEIFGEVEKAILCR